VNTYRGRPFTQASASATSIGLADAVVRTKVVVFHADGQSLAAGVDARLPTGREEDLLGAGTVSMRFSAIGSVEGQRLSAHANAGVVVGGLARELNYGAAVTAVASPRLTLSAEALGRWIESAGQIQDVAAPHPTLAGVETIRLASSASGLNIVTIAPGIKWNVTNTWVLVGNVNIPLTTAGLSSPITPFVGLDYSLQR
jgi:hypothetical protein